MVMGNLVKAEGGLYIWLHWPSFPQAQVQGGIQKQGSSNSQDTRRKLVHGEAEIRSAKRGNEILTCMHCD